MGIAHEEVYIPQYTANSAIEQSIIEINVAENQIFCRFVKTELRNT
jgi:hypothetical protein